MIQASSKAREIVATGQVGLTTIPALIDGIQVSGGDQGAVNKLTLTDGSGGPVVAYVMAAANTTTDMHCSNPMYCANGVFVAAFTNAGNANIILRVV